jgi:hypothetical protein
MFTIPMPLRRSVCPAMNSASQSLYARMLAVSSALSGMLNRTSPSDGYRTWPHTPSTCSFSSM